MIVGFEEFLEIMQRFFYGFVILFCLSAFTGKSFGNALEMNSLGKQTRVRAPEFESGKDWLNTDKPLSISGLKGKIVLLDFWTYGCVNCIHIIPDLKKLEAKYNKELVVIGVHSAKFENEKNTQNIRNIILRYGIEHPIVNDANFSIWNSYVVQSWPTLVLIDPSGYIVGQVSGEGHYEVLDNVIGKTATEFRKKGELNDTPIKAALERSKIGDLPLAFPGKIIADEKSDRLFISDSNHNRIVVTKLDGTLLETIGSGKAGLLDSDFAQTNFNRPQGLALDGDSLFVADTENHAIRRVNLKTKQVETIAGNGKQAEWLSTGGNAKTSAISTPWDLVKIGDSIFIAMAGTHQIWKLDLVKNTVAPFFGSGREARLDGNPEQAAFAQPSGIATDGKRLFVADSESNIIRSIDLKSNETETLVGGDLFDFGDKDGSGDSVRLQHPLGVAFYQGSVLIADTYNHKIKSLAPEKKLVTTLFGNKAGQMDGANSQFYEPAGLSVANGKLYVADTNNHAIRIIDLATKQTSTLKLQGLQPPVANISNDNESFSPNVEEKLLPAQEIQSGVTVPLAIDVTLPENYHLNLSAPQALSAKIDDKSENLKFKETNSQEIIQKKSQIKLPIRLNLIASKQGMANLDVRQTIYFCREDNTGTCYVKTIVWKVPLRIVDKKSANISEIKLVRTLAVSIPR